MSIFDCEPISVSEPLLISAAELASLLKLSTRSLWRHLSAGQIPKPVRIGGTVRWRLEEVRNWIAAGCPFPQARENERRRK